MEYRKGSPLNLFYTNWPYNMSIGNCASSYI